MLCIAGAVPLLIDIVRDGSSAVQSAVVALEKLCSHSSGAPLLLLSTCSHGSLLKAAIIYLARPGLAWPGLARSFAAVLRKSKVKACI